MSNVSPRNIRFATLSLLVSLLLILGFTPLGFISIPPVSITTMHIPVIIGSIILGPIYGGITGLVFGLISLLKAITGPAGPVDLLFSPFASGSPLYSLIMCIGPRVILGILPGLLSDLLYKRMKNKSLGIAISAGLATACHTIMVLGCLSIFFKALPIKEVFLTIISLNGSLEILSAVLIVPAVAIPLKKTFILPKKTII